MTQSLSLSEFRQHLDRARERLGKEKTFLQAACPLTAPFHHEAYVFAYRKAERLGLRAINQKLAELTWLPLHLDPQTEVGTHHKKALTQWMRSESGVPPSAADFGNDFIHALTRCALQEGFDGRVFLSLATRIATLFRDLSCFVGLIYYGTWLSEHQVRLIALTDPDNLTDSAAELTVLVQSSDVLYPVRAEEQQNTSIRVPPLIVTSLKKQPRFRVVESVKDPSSDLNPFIS